MEHSPISPSALSRIMACPPSVKLSHGVPNYDSEWAAEGTTAHTITSACLRGGPVPSVLKLCNGCNTEFGVSSCPKCGCVEFRIDNELRDAIARCVQFCVDLGNSSPYVMNREIDTRLVSSRIPDFGGTVDFLTLYQDEQHRTWLHVVDFKFGAGVPVDVKQNPQLMAYLLLAHERYPKVKWFRGTIHQPRVGDGRPMTSEFTLSDLQNFFVSLVDVSLLTDSEDYHEGPHCRWCPAAIKCPLVGGTVEKLLDDETSPDVLVELYIRFIRAQKAIRSLLESVPNTVIQLMREGVEFPGLKTTTANTHRRWNADALNELLAAGIPEEDLYSEQKLVTPAQLENKGYANLVARLSHKPLGRVTVIAEEEAREPRDVFGSEFPDI